MTYYSMRLAECPPETTDGQLSNLRAPLHQLDSLNHHAADWGTYRLRQWATDRSLRVHYVDNCWLRVEASAGDVLAFYAELGDLAPTVSPSARYIIEAEEY